jgi:hypothetical protein
MAYTTPDTAVTGVVAPASMWNSGVRDNMLAMMHPINRKTSDQSVTSSVTVVDCTTMFLPLLANEVWEFSFNIVYGAATTGDIKFGFTFPASGRIDATTAWRDNTGAIQLQSWTGTTTPSSAFNVEGLGTANRVFYPIRGIFTNSTNAGNLQLQFAQATSDAGASTVYTNSTVWGARLA